MAYKDARNYFDRELSWLAFNKRVLEEAQDDNTPLLERLKFLGIVATNLDEFFMVRVSGVQEHIISGIRRNTLAGYTPAMQFSLIHQEARKQVDSLYACYREQIVPQLAAERITVTHPNELSRKLVRELRDRFDREVFPVLTPLAVDAGHPFPRLKGLSLNLIVRVESAAEKPGREPVSLVAIVPVPSMLPRLVEIPSQRDRRRFVLLEDFIMEFLPALFPGLDVVEAIPFRVTRDADIEYKEIEAEDLLKHIEMEIRERERGMAVRVEIDERVSDRLLSFLMTQLNVGTQQVYKVNGPIAIDELSPIWKMEGREDLREEPFTPNVRSHLRGPGSIFSKIRQRDILLHHPYESFVPVVDFITAAADDPRVLAIKQTLYRTSGDSPLIKALIRAAQKGKQVAALVELKARFDEENNIVWARQLEEAGVHVVYGLVGLKTHCKVALVVRAEKSGIRRYVHLSTGNYNPTTARLYTDIGLFTCDPGFCDDASDLFNMLTGYAREPQWQQLIVAPNDLRTSLEHLINEQRELAEAGKPARIRAKMNSLVDQDIIIELYRASNAGVKIDLCIRGICCLRPGVKGLSENIRVWSIVDRFLEHSRVFIFGEAPDEKVFLSSADWMDRNMDRRIETMFPVLQDDLKQRCIHEVFAACARDNVKARYLGPDGRYRRAKPRAGETPYRMQVELMNLEEEIGDRGDWKMALPADSATEAMAPTLIDGPEGETLVEEIVTGESTNGAHTREGAEHRAG